MNIFISVQSGLMIALFLSLTAHADIYKCVNNDGKTTYQNSPCEIRQLKSQQNLIRESSSHPQSFNNRYTQPSEVRRPRIQQRAVAPTLPNQAYRSMVGASALIPGAQGGMVIGGPLSGTLMSGAQAWRDCIPNSIGPGGCDSIGPGGGQSIGPGGGLSIGPGGGQSIGPGGGQSIGPGGGQSIGPGGSKSLGRDRAKGLNTDTLRPYESGIYRPVGGPLNGTLMPGASGGMVVGGPLNGTLMPPH